ncbi:MAG: GntR family transcriptional regulator, partial [Actinobacteria bacterium]|nr:GntR family transcriptional regulator [Actinomycetota bacterium]
MTEAKNSLTYDTFVRLRNSIIQGVIRPNERLIAADLATSLNISRTPVREALQLLEAEQLVISVKRGFVVREHSRSEIIEIYQVRAALEGMAAKLVAQQTSDSSIAAIEGIGAHLPEL